MNSSLELNVSRAEKRWLRRVIDNEAQSVGLLILAAVLGIGIATINPSFADTVLHTHLPVLNLSLAEFAADGLLAIFFFIAGLELRHELTVGTLNSVRAAAVPVVAAVGGMLAPVFVFLALAPAGFSGAWGIPMATDLPLALAIIAVFGKRLPLSFRAFILSLAIVDDVGSVLVIAVKFGASVSVGALLLVLIGVVAYVTQNLRAVHGSILFAIAIATWFAMLHSGIHPTVLGVVLGLATSVRADRYREKLQPWSNGVCVPLFVFTAVAMPVSVSLINSELTSALIGARITGKPLGVFLGAVVALALFRPTLRLPLKLYVLAGVVASLGFSVSMLFALLSLRDAIALAQAQTSILAALSVAAIVTSAVLMLFNRLDADKSARSARL